MRKGQKILLDYKRNTVGSNHLKGSVDLKFQILNTVGLNRSKGCSTSSETNLNWFLTFNMAFHDSIYQFHHLPSLRQKPLFHILQLFGTFW